MEKIIIPVDDVFEGKHITQGFIANSKNVQHALSVIYPADQLFHLFQSAGEAGEKGLLFFDRFCQYIIMVQIKVTPVFEGALSLIDCHNDVEAALDEYNAYAGNSWDEATVGRFMELYYLAKQEGADIVTAELAVNSAGSIAPDLQG